jgi:PGF-CTERM protein
MKIVLIAIALALTMVLTSAIGLAQNIKETENLGTNISAMNIVEVANANGDFDTLVNALEAAGLAGTLSGPGPYTVFAPTDEAFNKLPRAMLADLTANMSQRDVLRGILAYHVVPGRLLASDLADGMLLKTVEGENLNVTVDNGKVMVNGANVVQPNINASNGVIHAIDAVLMPLAASTALMESANATAVAIGKEGVVKRAEETVERESPAQEKTEKESPGFESALAVAGLLAVAFLTFRRR